MPRAKVSEPDDRGKNDCIRQKVPNPKFSANIVKAESKTSNLFECSTEAHPIFARQCKYSESREQNIKLIFRLLEHMRLHTHRIFPPFENPETVIRYYLPDGGNTREKPKQIN